MGVEAILKHSKTQFEQIRETGHQFMAERSVAICGLARDCAQNLTRLIPRVEELGSLFREYRVIVVENDSQDSTGDVVAEWGRRNAAVQGIRFCYFPARQDDPAGGGWFGSQRMKRMAFARNKYLDAVCSQALPDFIIMIDLDIKSFSATGIEHSFGLQHEWDVIAANGTRYCARHPLSISVYWDSYAYEPAAGFPGGIQTAAQIHQDQKQVAILLKNGDLLPARSAFGGLGIYRAEMLKAHRYSVMVNDDCEVPVLCDHPTLHRSMRTENSDLRLMVNPHLKVDYGSVTEILRELTLRKLQTRTKQ